MGQNVTLEEVTPSPSNQGLESVKSASKVLILRRLGWGKKKKN